jgi:hypothetical protein
MGFSVIGYFRGRPWLCFVVGLAGLMDSWETSGVGKGASNLSKLTSQAVLEVLDQK